MQTLTDNDIEICPRCNTSLRSLNGTCAVCGAAIGGDAELLIAPKKRNTAVIKVAVYFTSAMAFSIGMLEGFGNNNSAAMGVDFLMSLVVLSLIPKAYNNPVATLIICIVVAFAIPLLLPLLNVVPAQEWIRIRLVLLFIPLLALIVHYAAKRV